MSDLKPCPFCGSAAILDDRMFSRDGVLLYHEYQVVCSSCGARVYYGQTSNCYKSQPEAIKEAIEWWNRRANDGTD